MAVIAGEKIKLTAQFTDDSDVATSPSTPVKIYVREPGNDGTPDVDGDSVSEGATGYFEYLYTTVNPGTLHYKFTSADGAVEQGTKKVEKDEV